MVTNAPWYVPNHVLHSDLQIPTIPEEITGLSNNYKAKIDVQPNKLTTNIFENSVKADNAATHHSICRLDLKLVKSL